jgi:hypothetical protein
MAVSSGDLSELTRSALGMVAQRRGELEQSGQGHLQVAPSVIARRLQERFPEFEGLTPQQARAIAERAIAMERAGRAARNNPDAVRPGSDLPRDPTIGPHQPRYRYHVRMSADRPGQSPASTIVRVASDVPMSQAQIAAFLSQHVDLITTPERADRQAILTAARDGTATIEVIYAGRR